MSKKLIIKENGEIAPTYDCNVSILNVGAGRTLPIDLKNFETHPFLVNLDKNYIIGEKVSDIEELHSIHNNHETIKSSRSYRCQSNVYKFLETYYNKFDLITTYRFLEHVEFSKVLYFIYLLSQIVEKDGLVDVIVPDYKVLAGMILDEDPFFIGFEANNILLTTELLNEPYDPHASIWTKDRIIFFFTDLEKRFIVERIVENFEFEGRDIYIRAILRRL